MAVNTQKLLPSAKKTSVLAKANVGKIFSSASIKTKKIDTKQLIGPLAKRDEPDAIVNTLTDIDTRLKLLLGEEKRQQSRKKKEKEKAKFQKAEEKLEAPKESKKFKLPGLAIPGMSFLDRIKRFLFFTALGWLFTKFQDQLPKLEGIVKTITQVYGVAEGIFKSLLNGLVNFIDIGYQTYDGLRKKVEDLGGKDAVKTFDDLSNHLNKLLTGAIIASTLIAGTAPKKPNAPSGAGAAAGVQKPTTPKPISGFGGGTEMTPGRYRTPGQSAAKGFGLQQARKGLTFEQSVAAQRASKPTPTAKGARFGGGRIPIIGPLITFGVRTMVYGEKPQKAAAAAIGMGIGQAVGGFIGTLGAGALGLGTAGLGAVVAPLIIGAGSVIGGLVGEWLGAKLYDFVAGLGKNKPQLKAAGGPVTRGGKTKGSPTRTIKVTRRKPPKVKPQQSQPGKDVGGKKKIRELYPDPSARTDIEGEQKGAWWDGFVPIPKLKENATDAEKKEHQRKIDEKNKKIKSLPNSYKALTGVAKILKDIPFGIGALMGGAVDIALGQKLPKNAIEGLSNGISHLINTLANQQAAKSISGIQKEISTMQTGGVTPRLRDFSRNERGEFGSGINKVLSNLIQQKVDEAIREVQKQLMPGKYGERKEEVPPGSLDEIDTSPGNIKVTSDSPDFWLLVTAALFENGISTDGYQGAVDAAQAIYNRVSLPGWPKSIRGVILAPGQFQPVRDYGGTEEWSQINSKESAIKFAKKYKGYGGNIVERIAASLLDRSKQEKARTFVGPRDSFRSDSFEKSNDHLDDSTEVSRYGHTFGFEPRGANIGRFKKGKLMPAEVNKQIIKGDILETGAGYGSAGGKIAGELGRFMKKKGVVPGSIHRHPEHPPYSLTSGHSKGSLHYQGRAIDLGAYANEQGPVLKAIAEFNKLKGVKPVQLLHAGNEPGGHSDHVHVAYQGGGLISPSKPNRPPLNSYPSYSTEGGMMIAIQPVIIEKPVPVPSGKNRSIMFPIPVGVNNNNSMQSLSRG
jgi:hypothetical protein